VFEYDGLAWTEIFPATAPPLTADFFPPVVYDPIRRSIIFAGSSGLAPGTVWELAYRSAHADEDCDNDADDDGDGFEDCYDPDCESHPACAPIE
jgi:hypothetical protein